MTCQIRSIVTVYGKKNCGDKLVKSWKKKSGKFQCSFTAHIEVTIILLYRVAQKERMFLKWVVVGYLPAISFFGVTSNQKSTLENLVQSTI